MPPCSKISKSRWKACEVSEIKLRFGLPEASLSALQAVLSRHPRVAEARIYGSRAKGNHRPGSDIDLTLLGPELSAQDLLRIEIEIEELGLPYAVDLSLFDQIDSAGLRSHIERVGQVFFRPDQCNSSW